MNDVLLNAKIVPQELFSIFGKTVAAITKAWIVIEIANARVHTHPINDIF
jgi:hypothetical protein